MLKYPKEYKLSYAALLTKESYNDGAFALAKSHSNVKSIFPLIFLISNEISKITQEKILKVNSMVVFKLVDGIYPLNKEIELSYAFPHFNEVWTKLRCFELIEYDYVCCLDCDMLFLKNIDEFLLNGSKIITHRDAFIYNKDIGLPKDKIHLMAAHTCVCNPMKRNNYPKWWKPDNCSYINSFRPDISNDILKIDFEFKLTNLEDIKTFPELKYSYFNSGLFIISPNFDIFNHLLDIILNLNSSKIFQFPEQDLLNLFFINCWASLPLSINFLKTILVSHPHLYQKERIYNIHYIMDKPWNFNFDKEEAKFDLFFELNKLWKDIFNN